MGKGGGSLGPWVLCGAHPMVDNVLGPAGASAPVVGDPIFVPFDKLIPLSFVKK